MQVFKVEYPGLVLNKETGTYTLVSKARFFLKKEDADSFSDSSLKALKDLDMDTLFKTAVGEIEVV